MRPIYFSFIALLAATPGIAAEIDADSAVTAATLYSQGALVTRTVSFRAGVGTNSIVIDDLPLDFDPASLRVAGTGDTAFSIVSVNHRIDRLPPVIDTDSPQQLAVEAIEEKLRLLEVENRAHYAAIQAAEVREKMIAALIAREPQRMVDEADVQRAGPETWAAAIGVLASETSKALAEKNAAQLLLDGNAKKGEDLQEELILAQEALAASQLPTPDRSTATVEILSDASVNGTLALSYYVWQASWQPVYDLRLEQGAQPRLTIERHARVQQLTGEDWSDVALTLSTAQRSERMDAPELREQQAVLAEVYETAEAGNLVYEAPAEAEVMAEAQSGVLRDDASVAVEVLAGVRMQGQTVVYDLPAAVDISGDGTIRQLAIDKASANVGVLARATPEFDSHTYLYAAIVNKFGGPILPGRAAAFRDGTFVGELIVPMIPVGKETILPFGVLDGIEVTRVVLEKEEGDFGLIGTTNRRVENFEITAESLLEYPMTVTIFDRVPFSEAEDLEVITRSQPAPTEVDFEGKRGVQTWTFELPPKASQKIEFGFELNWPGDRDMYLQ